MPAAGKTTVLFGLRHSPASRGKLFRGRLLRARVYDRALSADEVDASYRGDRRFVSQSQIVAAMTDGQQQTFERLREELAEVPRRRGAFAAPAGYRGRPQRLWRDFAQCLFNLKEFIYLK